MLAYCFLEFLSLLMVIIVLGRILGFSTLRQLAFVLEMQAGIIQTQLVSLLLYIMQISLAHIGTPFAPNYCRSINVVQNHSLHRMLPLAGADFTFRFAWLHGA